MGKEDLSRIPATAASLFSLRDAIQSAIQFASRTDYGSFTQAVLSPTETVRIFDITKLDEGAQPSRVEKFRIFVHEEIEDTVKTTIYKFTPDDLFITKSEFVEPNVQHTTEELEAMVEKTQQDVKEIEENGWRSFLEKYPEKRKKFKDIADSYALEEEVGLTFVSEAEIQNLIAKLSQIDPNADIF